MSVQIHLLPVRLNWQISATKNELFAGVYSEGFLVRLETALLAVVALMPVSFLICAQDKP